MKNDPAAVGFVPMRAAVKGLVLGLFLAVASPAIATPEYILPTLFDVTGVAANDVLNIRAAPSASAASAWPSRRSFTPALASRCSNQRGSRRSSSSTAGTLSERCKASLALIGPR